MNNGAIDYKTLVKAYLDAFDARDIDRCMTNSEIRLTGMLRMIHARNMVSLSY